MNAGKIAKVAIVVPIIVVPILVLVLAARIDQDPAYRLRLIKDVNREYKTSFHQSAFQSISTDRLRALLQSDTRGWLSYSAYTVIGEEGKLCSLQNGNELWYITGQVFQIGYRYEYETGREYRYVETPSIFLRVPPESLLVNWSNAKTSSCFTCGEVAKALNLKLAQATEIWQLTKQN